MARIRRTCFTLVAALVFTGLTGTADRAEARDTEDCMQAWGRAVRGYLTQKRTSGPEDEAFKPACALEAKGDKAAARLEAVLIGMKALAALDMKGCGRFMGLYIGATLPEKLCEATKTEQDQGLREMVKDSLPAAQGG